MHRKLVSLLTLGAIIGLTVASVAVAQAAPREGPTRAVSYINPDTGKPTFNPNVDPNSECASPDQFDSQKLSVRGQADRNVHNDACLFVPGARFDGPASFVSFGVGFVSACPDPDGAGPKVAITYDRNGDGNADRCFMSGYQETGMDGDREYHTRLDNFTMPGSQGVLFCYDPENNGCNDARVVSRIIIRWSR